MFLHIGSYFPKGLTILIIYVIDVLMMEMRMVMKNGTAAENGSFESSFLCPPS